MTNVSRDIKAPRGKLGVLLPGMRAVSTTLIAGVEAIKKGLGKPIGSLTQMARIRLGKRDEQRNPLIKDFVPLHPIEDIVFGGWDIFPDDAYEAARKARVLSGPHLDGGIEAKLRGIKPWPGVFDPEFVRRLRGKHVKKGRKKQDLVDQLRDDIRGFKKKHRLRDAVMLWCASTEVLIDQGPVHASTEAFEKGLKKNDPGISPSMMYAYASLMEDVPYANGAPHLNCEIPALTKLALERGLPICGKDFKTGQTLMKTIVAPGLRARMLGLAGWYSTNILGNRDGEVLDDPGSFKSKEVSKLSVLDQILEPKLYPDLYGNISHLVRINYYPPRGDDKEGWDNIDIFGWLGYPMQIKINFLCRDSILAAPVVLDLALFLDLARRAGLSGIQEWLSFYFKSPMAKPGLGPIHDLFAQKLKMENVLRHLMGEEIINYLGLVYYGLDEE